MRIERGKLKRRGRENSRGDLPHTWSPVRMNVTRYDTVDAFLEKAQVFLERDEALNGLILGNCLRMLRHPERTETPPLLVTVEEDSTLLLAAMMMPPNKILLAAKEGVPATALEWPVRALRDWDCSVSGVFATDELAASFAETWAEVTGQVTSSEGMHQRLYTLTSVKEVPTVAGRLRESTRIDRRAPDRSRRTQEAGPQRSQVRRRCRHTQNQIRENDSRFRVCRCAEQELLPIRLRERRRRIVEDNRR